MSPLLYILIGVGAFVGVGLFVSRRKAAREEAARKKQRLLSGANVTNDITGVGRGGVLRVPAFGSSPAARETHVVARHRYTDDEHAHYELVCEVGTRHLVVDWGLDDGALYVNAGFDDDNPSLGQLGLDEAALADMDERESGDFEWDGVRWRYAYSCETFFYENSGRQKVGFYRWSFADRGETRTLNIEKWAGDQDFRVSLRWALDPGDIEVYSAGEEA